jgi:glycerol-3-phosphate acyltransferase PlsY
MASSITLALLIAFVVGYLAGSIPFGLILTRAAGLGDVRQIGSGNIGATNVLRTGRKGLAAATLLLDGLKGTAGVLLTVLLAPRLAGLVPPDEARVAVAYSAPWAAVLGAVAGHVYPVWLGFRGGKGVATYIGALAGAHWPAALLFGVAWLGTAALSRISSLSALVALAVVAAYFVAMGSPTALGAIAPVTLLIAWKHEANIRRLLKGEEPRIGAKG